MSCSITMAIKVTPIVLGFVLCAWTACKPTDPTPPTPQPEIDQFPELVSACSDWLDGGGSATVGGAQGGTIYRVSSLEDTDPYNPQMGTLRYAVNQTGPRVIVFNVAGTIYLKAPLEIKNGNISILGQSAPGQGICLADYPIVIKNTHDVVLRFIRCRLGNKSLEKDPSADYDAISINDSRNIMVDHCSFSWSVDECVSCYGNKDFTLQYCFVTEALRDAGHPKGAHGYGGIWGGQNASFHHNLLAHHDSRNPRFDHDYVDTKYAGPIDLVNNVVYNWGGNSAYGGEGSTHGKGGRHINFVNNYYQPGPSTGSDVNTRLVDPWTKCSNCTDACGGSVDAPKIYLVGNTMSSSEAVTADNWKGSTKTKSVAGTDTRWTEGLTALKKEQTAAEAYATVLAKAGCSLQRDAVDQRIVEEVRNGSGHLIDNPSEVGGWPELDGESTIVDTDKDGIPDEWETKYGLDPNNVLDAGKTTLVTGHINIDVYLSDLVKDYYPY